MPKKPKKQVPIKTLENGRSRRGVMIIVTPRTREAIERIQHEFHTATNGGRLPQDRAVERVFQVAGYLPEDAAQPEQPAQIAA